MHSELNKQRRRGGELFLFNFYFARPSTKDQLKYQTWTNNSFALRFMIASQVVVLLKFTEKCLANTDLRYLTILCKNVMLWTTLRFFCSPTYLNSSERSFKFWSSNPITGRTGLPAVRVGCLLSLPPSLSLYSSIQTLQFFSCIAPSWFASSLKWYTNWIQYASSL